MSKKISVPEAKKNFEEAVDALSPAVFIKKYPIESATAAAAAGAAAAFSGRRALRSLLTAADILGLLAKFFMLTAGPEIFKNRK